MIIRDGTATGIWPNPDAKVDGWETLGQPVRSIALTSPHDKVGKHMPGETPQRIFTDLATLPNTAPKGLIGTQNSDIMQDKAFLFGEYRMTNTETLLIGCSAPFYRDENGALYVENQTISGLHGWQQNFKRVIAFAICHESPIPEGWSLVSESNLPTGNFELVSLPNTYKCLVYLKEKNTIERKLLRLMKSADYRVFSFGGATFGPGTIAAAVARKNGLRHCVWLDRVESKLAIATSGKSVVGRLKGFLKSKTIFHNELVALRSAELALLHGRTVFEALAVYSLNPQIGEDIHLSDDDHISPMVFNQKLKTSKDGPLRLAYVGRASQMKGPFDWIDVLMGLAEKGVDFQAEWVGSGELLDEMKKSVADKGLSERVYFHGFITDRARVLKIMCDAHILLFCHLTDESPRNLIEALHSALPLVGYKDPYAQGLVEERGAGILVNRGDKKELILALSHLDADREGLGNFMTRAYQSAKKLTRDEVFSERSAIVREHL